MSHLPGGRSTSHHPPTDFDSLIRANRPPPWTHSCCTRTRCTLTVSSQQHPESDRSGGREAAAANSAQYRLIGFPEPRLGHHRQTSE